jgi:hypothetical protein
MEFKQIEQVIKTCEKHLQDTDSWGTEIETFLTRYILINMYATYDENIIRILGETRRVTPDCRIPDCLASQFVHNRAPKQRHISLDDIRGCLSSFSPSLKEEFDKKSRKSTAEYITFIETRNSIAHQENPVISVTFKDLTRVYKSTLRILTSLEEALNK